MSTVNWIFSFVSVNTSFLSQEHVSDPSSYGIHVVDRKFVSVEESVRSLAQIMFDFSQLTRRQRIIMRNRTERLSDLLDWRRLGGYYSQARARALASVWPEEYTQYTCTLGEGGGNWFYSRPASSYSSHSRRTRETDTENGDDIETEENDN